jgi:two-component system, NtrC family, response regulator HupR/HoxA
MGRNAGTIVVMGANRLEVLVVDDEPDILEFVERALRRAYAVTTCGGADEALALVSQRRFAAIVTDHKMPRTSGLELLKQLANADDAMARILLSGYTESPEVDRALVAGSLDAHAVKPIDSRSLLDVIARAIAKRRGPVPQY